ncbi:MAG: glutathione peroxidase [Cyclobacteriaceae bacterium]|jgi:glutathione peroxidase
MKTPPSLYDFEIKALNSDEMISLKNFEGKHILFVNVASKCGFTPQYAQLQKLYEQYQDNLVVVGLPCNQFLWQESGGEDKIASFCAMEYGTTFPITTKVKVKGGGQHPIYRWLTRKAQNGLGDFKVSWNFNKFLVNPEGQLVEHFGSKVLPDAKEITKYLETASAD